MNQELSPAPVLDFKEHSAVSLTVPARPDNGGETRLLPTDSLRPHPAFKQIDWQDIDEFNRAAKDHHRTIEPLYVTTDRIILSGIGRWKLALIEGTSHLRCIEYNLDANQALQVILAHSGGQKGLNAFVRIRLALTLEEYLRLKGRENMAAAAKSKGLTNSSNLTPVDVRRSIADLAGTGTGNIDKVRAILRKAHRNIVHALQVGSLRIHRAWTWCDLSKIDQLNAFQEYEEALAMRSVTRRIDKQQIYPSFSTQQILQSLERLEISCPGKVHIQYTGRRETVVLVGKDLFNEIPTQKCFNGLN